MKLKKRNKGLIALIVLLGIVIVCAVYWKVQADEQLKELKIEKPMPKPNKIPKDKSDLKSFKSE